jgi:hypothetical protein
MFLIQSLSLIFHMIRAVSRFLSCFFNWFVYSGARIIALITIDLKYVYIFASANSFSFFFFLLFIHSFVCEYIV